MTYFAISFALMFISGLIYIIVRDIRHPAVLQSLVWTTTLFVYSLMQSEFYGLNFSFIALVFGSIAFFGAGSIIMGKIILIAGPNVNNSDKHDIIRMELPKIAKYIGIITFTLSMLYAYIAYKYASSGPTGNVGVNLRYILTSGQPIPTPLKVFGYLFPFSNAFMGFLLFYYLRTRSKSFLPTLYLTIFSSLIMSIVSSGRGIVLFVILQIIFIALFSLKKIKLSFILFGILSIIAVFFSGAFILNKGVDSSGSTLARLTDAGESLGFYISSGSVAFSQLSNSSNSQLVGENTFRILYIVADHLGFDVAVAPLIQEFIPTPQITNVYTMHLQYFRDFGIIGCIIFQFLFGIVHGLVYGMAVKVNSAIWVIWASILTFPIITQSFTDSYLSLTSSWIQYIFHIALLSVFVFKYRRLR